MVVILSLIFKEEKPGASENKLGLLLFTSLKNSHPSKKLGVISVYRIFQTPVSQVCDNMYYFKKSLCTRFRYTKKLYTQN